MEGVDAGKFKAGKPVLRMLIKTEWPHLRVDQIDELIKWVEEGLPAQRERDAQEAAKRRADEREMREIFDALDTDGGGTIGLREFCQLKLTCPALDLPESRLKEIYHQADTDGSGELDFDEFAHLVAEYNLMELSGQIVRQGRRRALCDTSSIKSAVALRYQ